MSRYGWRDSALLGLLAVLPLVAHGPAWTRERLLGPGEGAALHFPMRDAVWRSYRAFELPSWDPGIFSGTPLLAAYRPGALHPFTILLAGLSSFTAFQVLVLVSLGLSAALLYVYVRVLGGNPSGAYASGLFFSLGPILVDRLGDTATVAAAPMVVLLLLALELQLAWPSGVRTAFVAVATVLLATAGSPEAAIAGAALVLARLLASPGRGASPAARPRATLGLVCGLLLAAPQLIPTGIAIAEAGPASTGLVDPAGTLSGAIGLLVRYVSHTPAPALALAALPILLFRRSARGFALALALALPVTLAASGLEGRAAALVFDLALSVLAGLVLSEHAASRCQPRGRRLRAYVLVAAVASAAALSVAATLTGPLPDHLAGAVGVLALAYILFLTKGGSRDPVLAQIYFLPLTASLLLQPHGRDVWSGAPTRAEIEGGTPTREAIDRAMRPRREERTLSLVTAWPSNEALDLAYAGLGAVAGRRNANGYDPLVPARRRLAFDGMSALGTLPPSFLRTDPERLDFLGIRFVQVQAADLLAAEDAHGLGDEIDLVVDPSRPRFFPVPIAPATEIRIASALSEAVLVPQGTVSARIRVRLASGRDLPLVLRAGYETAEWAFDRPDVRPLVRHEKAKVLEAFQPVSGSFTGWRYLGVLRLNGRYMVDGIGIESLLGQGGLSVFRLGLFDAVSGRSRGVSATAAYVSDILRFREAAATPFVRLFELRGTLGRARVVDSLRRLGDDDAVLHALRQPLLLGIDPRREALATAADVLGVSVPQDARTSRAVLARSSPSRFELRAEGPGVLVVTEGFDPGWSARVDDAPVRVFRANFTHLGVILPEGTHRVAFAHHPRGFTAGLVVAALGGTLLLVVGVARPKAEH